LGRTEDPVRIREVVQEAKVFEAPVSRVEPIPFRLLDTHPQITLRIRAPTGRTRQQSFEETALAIFRLQQKRAIEKSRPGPVVQIALVLVVIAVNTETAIPELDT
jgi:hypothetical protein